MLVYRCITQMEILNKFKEINDEVISYKGANTHKYEKDISYIHFFRYKKSAEYYLNNNSSFFNPFILYMIADIPLDENNMEYKKYLELFKYLLEENKYNVNKVALKLKNSDLDELLNNFNTSNSNDSKTLIKQKNSKIN